MVLNLIFLILLVVILLLIIYSWRINYKVKIDLKKALDNKDSIGKRPLLNRISYIDFFLKKGYKKKDIDFVYSGLKQFFNLEESTLYPTDDFYTQYALNSFEMEELELLAVIEKNHTFKQIELDEVNDKFEFFNAEVLLYLINTRN